MKNVNHVNYFKKAEESKEEVVVEEPKLVLEVHIVEEVVSKPKAEKKLFKNKKFK